MSSKVVWTADEIRRADNNNEEEGRNTEPMRNLNLVLTEDSDFEELTEAIAELEDVKRVVISCVDEDEPDWSLADVLEDLFMALGSRPKLQTVKLKHLGYEEDNPFPISLVRDLLIGNHSRSSSIHTVHLQDSGLVNDDEMFREFSETLRVQTQLKRFKIESCSIANDPSDSSVAMDHVVTALGSLPNLKDVALEVEEEPGELGQLSDPALRALCATRNLESLHLDGFELDDECLIIMANALRTTTRLKKLILVLYGDVGSGCSDLADMLRVNESLEVIRFYAYMDVDAPTFLSEVADALIRNTSIRDAKFYGFDEIGDSCELAFAKMLKSNDTLQTLVLSGGHDERLTGQFRPTIDFYLRLNKRGRRRVTRDFESIGREDWVKIIADCASDLDCLFFYLQMNPLLCSIPDINDALSSSQKPKGTATISKSEEVRRLRRELQQLKHDTMKQNEILFGQQCHCKKMLQSNQETVSLLRESYEQQIREKDSKISELKTDLTTLQQRVASIESFMNEMDPDKNAQKRPSQQRNQGKREALQTANDSSVRVNPDLPHTMHLFWASGSLRKQPPLNKVLKKGGSNTSDALNKLGFDRNCCGHYFIRGLCSRRNCTYLHSHPNIPSELKAEQVVELLRTGYRRMEEKGKRAVD